MKKLILISCILALGSCLFAQGITGNNASESIFDAEEFEEQKTKTEVIIPKEQHCTDQSASVRIEYMPIYDEVRIYYECMYVTYDRGEAMNTVLQCLADFQQEHKYYSYRYLRNDKERFFKDDKGRRKAQYMSYLKFSR